MTKAASQYSKAVWRGYGEMNSCKAGIIHQQRCGRRTPVHCGDYCTLCCGRSRAGRDRIGMFWSTIIGRHYVTAVKKHTRPRRCRRSVASPEILATAGRPVWIRSGQFGARFAAPLESAICPSAGTVSPGCRVSSGPISLSDSLSALAQRRVIARQVTCRVLYSVEEKLQQFRSLEALRVVGRAAVEDPTFAVAFDPSHVPRV